MIRELKTKWSEDRGAALAIVATTLFLLMGVAAISADLAWYYLNASRVQRAADAAALAGVVHLPTAPGTASSTAVDIANRNGYDSTLADVAVTPTQLGANQLQVRISDDVDTFFAGVLGWPTMTIARTAVAEYIPPLKLGSPDNDFGNACDPGQPGCSGQPNFWANIHGKWTSTIMGDAYSSWCANQSDNPGCAQNPAARDTGYLYGIESGAGFTVQFVDLAFHNTSGGNPTGDPIRTGDRGCEDWGPSNAPDCGPTMVVTLYAPDPTPLDVSDNTALCTATIPPAPQVPEADPYAWLTPDGQACWTQSGTGIYVLQVRHLDPGATTDRAGLNRYSVRSTTGNLFALGDFSIYNNFGGSTTSFYLAEVPSYYNGKTFVVELYDPGESANNGTLQVIDPTGSTFDAGECRIYSRNNPTVPWNLQQTIPAGSPCQELVTPGEYNGRWLKFEMDLPATYSCGTCWWQMNYVYTSGVNDTTTWRAYMIGNPIHIID
ncbi:MAG: hypothetical protein DWQ40_10685 [Actinobacteria bacterium]|nr:MAG: hypothetical protein DWQ40_10685 [Actinomycetota bacterium]